MGARAIANRQKGQLTTVQLRQVGWSHRMIARALGTGRLIPRHRGVYALGHTALPRFADEMAALLAISAGDALLSHTSAAPVLGLWLPRQLTEGPRDVHLILPGRQVRSRPGITVHCVARLDPSDRARRSGMAVTSVARTIVDLTAMLDHSELERTVDEAVSEGKTTRPLILQALGRAAPNHPGRAALVTLLDPARTATDTRSGHERRMRALCRRAGLPTPRTNVRIAPFTYDFLWPEHHLAVEIDSDEFHSTRRRRRRDQRKDAHARRHGLTLLRYGPEALHRRPEAILVELARLTAPRAARP